MRRTSRLPDGLIVRPADAEDDEAIDSVIRAAFSGTEFGHQGEAELVRMIEADGDVRVSLVAERDGGIVGHALFRSEEHTSELQSLMRSSYAVFCLQTKRKKKNYRSTTNR